LENEDQQNGARLQTVRELLRSEQRRVREFVDAANATDNEAVTIEMLRPLAEDTARLWGCAVHLTIKPTSTTISRRMLNQVSLMLAEAVANAVRHGAANAVRVNVTCRNRHLEIEVCDDGHGFPGIAVDSELTEISEGELPRTLRARLRELGGNMQARTSTAGSMLRLELSP
jgi:signal transduction histidine kinase